MVLIDGSNDNYKTYESCSIFEESNFYSISLKNLNIDTQETKRFI